MKTNLFLNLRRLTAVAFMTSLVLVTSACPQKKNSPASNSQPTPVTNAVPSATNATVGETSPTGLTVQLVKFESQSLGQVMSYNVLLPAKYQPQGTDRFPVIFLMHGLGGHFNDWVDKTDIEKIAEQYDFIIVMPEGNDSWYSDSPLKPKDKYESYIVKDLIGDVHRRFPQADPTKRIIAGLSMGGYGAMKFGLKYPKMFSMIGSFSGAFATATWTENSGGSKYVGKSIDPVLGPLKSEARTKNDVFEILRKMRPEDLSRVPYIYMSCGTEDTLTIKTNDEFDVLLREKGVMRNYQRSTGKHDWTFWGKEIDAFLKVVKSKMPEKAKAAAPAT